MTQAPNEMEAEDPLAGDVVSIKLDGVEMLTDHTIVAYNIKAGWIERYMVRDGKVVVGLPPAYNPRTEFVKGKVEVELRAAP